MFIDLPGADDRAILPVPCEHDHETVVVQVAQGTQPPLAVIAAPILGFEYRIAEDQGRIGKIDTVFGQVCLQQLSFWHAAAIPQNENCGIPSAGGARVCLDLGGYAVRSPSEPNAACAAARRATGTRYGLQET